MKEQFCSRCGSDLIRFPVPAEKAMVLHYSFGDVVRHALGDRYNPRTGLRQFGIRARCPNSRWYWPHTDYIEDDSLHDSDLPELMKL